MKICMMTNTYLPHVGGVARSVSTFADEYRRRKHEVLVVAPAFDGPALSSRAEAIVERVPAIQHFNGSDFSVRLPLAAALSSRLDAFNADIVHAHHPFLLGDTALRVAVNKNVPVIFTHHTRYEDYTHYVPFDSPRLKEIAVNLSTQFANLCDGVIAPSESIARLLEQRGVTTPMRVVPTGIDVRAFSSGDGARFRQKMKLPRTAFVVGHVGRLAPEKNLAYLGEAVALFVKKQPRARFLVIGQGPGDGDLKAIFARHGISDRLILAGSKTGRALADAYAAMDVFAFASQTETQGLVVAEAMAAGLPVVALNAPGVREVMRAGKNGFMPAARAPARVFAAHLSRLATEPNVRRALGREARATAELFSRERCADQALAFYEQIRSSTRRARLLADRSPWGIMLERMKVEWNLFTEKIQSVAQVVVA
jgi:glycosyltransferase involved in cell wall biosynthesis